MPTLAIFETWKHGDIRFLAFPNGNGGLTIVDEHGNNFGSWYEIAHFKKKYVESTGAIDNSLALGKCNLKIINIR
jgi:hypothetical protein